MPNIGENGITLWISSDGTVKERPDLSIHSTSHEMEIILQKIVPKVADYMEYLIWKEFFRNK